MSRGAFDPATIVSLLGFRFTTGSSQTNVNAFGSVNDCPSGLVTPTPTEPAGWDGVTAVRKSPPPNETDCAARPPNSTLAPDMKFAPAILTEVPPDTGPTDGATVATRGASNRSAVSVAVAAVSFGGAFLLVTAPAGIVFVYSPRPATLTIVVIVQVPLAVI